MAPRTTSVKAVLLHVSILGAGFIMQAACAIPARCLGSATPFAGSGATQTVHRRRHGEQVLTESQMGAVERQLAAWKVRAAAVRLPYRTAVPVYVHVIMTTTGTGNVTQKAIDAQIAQLNLDYRGLGSASRTNPQFNFTLVNVTRHVNDNWHTTIDGTRVELEAKQSTRIGGFGVLNLWIAGPLRRILGWSSLPFQTTAVKDGVWINYKTLPGGALTGYNLGRTATHEIGHWLGLYHVFEGGCVPPGDSVADTTPQKVQYGCNTAADTCPGGLSDSISNYMQYTDDCCMTEFTSGQRQRMWMMWGLYRAVAV